MKREKEKRKIKKPHEQIIYVGSGRNYLKSKFIEEQYKKQLSEGKKVCWIRKHNLD